MTADSKEVYLSAVVVLLGEISKHTLTRLRDGNLSDEDKILLSQRFINIASDNKDGRMHFHAFINNMMHFTKDTKPIFLVVPWEVYKMAIYCEMTIAGLDSDVAFIRKLFEAAIVSNPDNEELWLDYVRFESEKPGDVRVRRRKYTGELDKAFQTKTHLKKNLAKYRRV